MRILTICPSKYHHKLEKMLDSFHLTNNCSELVIDTSEDTVTNIFNKNFKKYPDFDYYHMTNDDVIYQTKDWDIILANKIINPGISYGNDSIKEGLKCQFPMISGDIVRVLGWIQMPTLNRYCGDVVWRFIGKECNCIHHCPEVIIDHQWEGADSVINIQDMGQFAQWLPWAFKDIQKVMRVVNGIS